MGIVGQGQSERLSDAARWADSAVGKGVERLIVARHRHRLNRLGLGEALETPAGGWAASGAPPQPGNTLDVLVDGYEALTEIANALEAARSSIWLAGWYFSPDFRLRYDSAETLRELLAAAAGRGVDVRLLAWAGAPLPVFRPTRSDVETAREALIRGTGIRMALDSRERLLHCHHEKVVVVDGEQAFVGGIDLTSYAGDRLDSERHPARGALGWHDVGAVIRGPAVADVAAHFSLRWHEVTGEELPAVTVPELAGEIELQVVRTVPEQTYGALPNGEFGILESYLRALRSARKLIYLENQFLWSPEVVSVLEDKLRKPPADGFRIVVVLPSKPNNGNDDTRGQLGVLAAADRGERLLACTIFQRGGGAPVYVHAKVGIVDDAWLTVGSANLNERSLFNDTEMNIVTHDSGLAHATRLRLWSEHLDLPGSKLDNDPTEVVDHVWRPVAEEQHERLVSGRPLTRNVARLPHVSRRVDALLGPINGLVVDG